MVLLEGVGGWEGGPLTSGPRAHPLWDVSPSYSSLCPQEQTLDPGLQLRYLGAHALLRWPHAGVEGLLLCQVHFLLGCPVLACSPSIPPAQHQSTSALCSACWRQSKKLFLGGVCG